MSTTYTFPQGIPGPQGPIGPPGPAGAPGPVTSFGGIFIIGTGGAMTPVIGTNWTMQATLGSNATINAPAVAYPGVCFLVQAIQDGTGGRTITWNSFYRGLSGFILDTTASTQAALLFQVSADGSYALLIGVPMNGAPIT